MDWHARYLQQARWTAQLRSYLFNKAGLQPGQRLLELGCGTGAVLADFPQQAGLCGLDLDFQALTLAAQNSPGARLTCGDGASLPFANAAFEHVFCHFVLLWVRDPERVVSELRRVTRPGGAVLALAEPDYGGRVDYPPELAELGVWQAAALRRQGADVNMGRKLAAAFSRAGLQRVQTGVMGGQWQGAPSAQELELEWQTLSADLGGLAPAGKLDELRALNERAWALGERVLYVPTFYAWGVV